MKSRLACTSPIITGASSVELPSTPKVVCGGGSELHASSKRPGTSDATRPMDIAL
ncbi:hypothetical protein [Nannocystis pusilla]|uniref:hypothetical protein n=1 Tax=Nannocystis pusilla TaxID=889268 RepID=UPI003B81630A